MTERRTGRPRIPDEVIQRHSEVVDIIKPYAEMGMSVRQIGIAVVIADKKRFSDSEIEEELTRARKSGDIPSLVKQKRNRTLIDDRIIEIDWVIERLIARDILVKGGVELPQGREKWDKAVIAFRENHGHESLAVVKRLLDRGATISEAVQISKLDGQETQDSIVRFAQELVGKGVIDDDPADAYMLYKICREKRINLSSFEHRIVLESFIKARKSIEQKDDRPIKTYRMLRSKSFLEEESEVSKELGKWEDFLGEIDMWGEEELNVDSMGFYRRGEEGEKWRIPLGVSVHGTVILDTPVSRLKREESRRRTMASRHRGRQTLVSKAGNSWEEKNPLDI